MVPPIGRFYPGSTGTGKISGRAGRNLAVGKTISALRLDSDCLALFIVKASQNDANDIENLPDKEATASAELNNTGDDLAGINAVNTTDTAANQQAEEEGNETGAGGLVIDAVGAAAHGMLYGGGLKKFFGACQLGLARVG